MIYNNKRYMATVNSEGDPLSELAVSPALMDMHESLILRVQRNLEGLVLTAINIL